MKEIIIVFGEMGVGKNYHGERIAKEKGYTFYDGDDLISGEMLEKVKKFKPISRQLILDFVNHLGLFISKQIHCVTNGLVIAQGLYSDEDRVYLRWYCSNILRCKVSFVWINPPFFRNMRQLYSRQRGLGWIYYWLISKPWFQKPKDISYELIK